MSKDSVNPAVPFSVACAGIMTFASMDVVMKGLSIELGAYNAMLWRCAIGFVLTIAMFLAARGRWPQRSVVKVHLWRGLVVSVMAFLFFWGLVHVPLAEAIGLSFIAPLIALYLAAVILDEHIGPRAVWASVIGFAGALIIIGGKLGGDYSEEFVWGVGAILLSAVMYAYNLILQRQQALIAGPVEIAMFQNGTVVVLYALFAPWFAVVPAASYTPSLFAAAALGILSVLALSWSYARAEAKTLIPVEYTAFIWAALFGWLVFNEELTLATVIGTALIVCGCLLAASGKQAVVAHVETTAV